MGDFGIFTPVGLNGVFECIFKTGLMVGDLSAVVIIIKFHQHWLSGYRAVRGRNLAYLIT